MKLAVESGQFLNAEGRIARANPAADDRDLARRLWEPSEQLVGLTRVTA